MASDDSARHRIGGSEESVWERATLRKMASTEPGLRRIVGAALACAPVEPMAVAVHLRSCAEWILRRTVRGVAISHSSLYDLQNSYEFRRLTGDDSTVRRAVEVLRTSGNAGAHGRSVRIPQSQLFDAAELLAKWWENHTKARAERFEQSPLDFSAPPAAALSTASATHAPAESGLYLLRRQGDTTIIRLAERQLTPVRTEVPVLLFGCGGAIWEWEPMQVRAPVSRVQGLEEYWDARDAGHPDFRVYVPIPDGKFVELARGQALGSELHPADENRSHLSMQADHPGGIPLGWRRTVHPVPSVGPWLLAFEHDRAFHGGAHDNWECHFWAADARTGRRRDLVAELSTWAAARPELHELAARQWLADAEYEQEDSGSGDSSVVLKVTAFRLDTNEAGAVALAIQFTGDECFAYCDGRWDSYTRSVEVVTFDLPEFLEVPAQLPAPIVDWARDNLGPLAGWSKLDLSDEELLLARLDHPPEGW